MYLKQHRVQVASSNHSSYFSMLPAVTCNIQVFLLFHPGFLISHFFYPLEINNGITKIRKRNPSAVRKINEIVKLTTSVFSVLISTNSGGVDARSMDLN